VRTYLQTLLYRKRGTYGPLWLFELAASTWAIVSEKCLEDEEKCHLILQQDPSWFNRDWGNDGRRPNPTYKTHQDALNEIIRSLQAFMVDLSDNHVEQSRYSTYIAHAEQDLRRPLNAQTTVGIDSSGLPQSGAEDEQLAASEAAGAAQAPEPTQPPVAPSKTAPAPALQALESKKPWEDLSNGSKGLNLPMHAELYAKMLWCTNNIPKMSLQKLARIGAELYADELIKKYYKAE
jgi:hypothetical protein